MEKMFERETKEERKERWRKQDEVFPRAILLGCIFWMLCFPFALIARIHSRRAIWYSFEEYLIEKRNLNN